VASGLSMFLKNPNLSSGVRALRIKRSNQYNSPSLFIRLASFGAS
jgi:hypothetical protein